jgi:DNA-binding HxlR family transcriptional regulator
VKRKSYCQYCPVAHALDLVGERWSLLIVRELLTGPRRYTDLAGALPGIGTNILAARLRDLETVGVLAKRKLPPPTPATVYELTDHGRNLQSVVAELALWGARSLGPPSAEELSPGWLRYPLQTFMPPHFAGRIEFHVGEEVASVDGTRVVEGEIDTPDTIVRTDPTGFYHLVVNGSSDGVTVEGDESPLVAFLERAAPEREPTAV